MAGTVRDILLRLVGDSTDGTATIDHAAEKVSAFGRLNATARLDILTAGVQAKLDAVEARLARYRELAQTADTPQLRIRTATAVAQIDRLQAKLNELRKPVVSDVSVRQQAAETTGRTSAALQGATVTALRNTPLVAGIGAGVGIKLAIDFQKEMERVRTQAGATQAEVQQMSKAVLDLGATTEPGPRKLATALFDLESVGLRGKTALAGLKAAAEGVALSGADLEETTSALASTMVAFHLSGDKARETIAALNAIVGVGKLHFADLNAALSSGILPTAQAVGLNLTDVGAALATLTDAGVPAEQAATKLRTGLFLLAAPTKAATAELDKIGLKQTDVANALRKPDGLVGALQLIKDHLAGLSRVQQIDVIARAFGGSRSAATIVTLLDNLDRVQNKYDAIKTGTSRFTGDLVAESQTASHKLNVAYASIQSSLIRLGQRFAPVAASAATAFAGVLTSVTGGIGTAITSVNHFFDQVSQKQKGGTLDPHFREHEGFSAAVVNTIPKPETFATALGTAIGQAIGNIDWNAIGSAIGDALSSSLHFADQFAAAVSAGISAAVAKVNGEKVLGKLVDVIAGALNALFSPSFWIKHFAALLSIVTIVIPIGKILKIPGFGFLFRFISKPFFDAFRAVGRGIISLFGDLASHAVTGFLSEIEKVAPRLAGVLLRLVTSARSDLGKLVSAFFSLARRAGGAILRGLENGTTKIGETIGKLIATAATALAGLVKAGFDAGFNLIWGLIRGIISGAKQLPGVLKHYVVDTPVNAVKDFFGIHSPSTLFHGFGVNLMEGLANGITAAAGKPHDALFHATKGLSLEEALGTIFRPHQDLGSLFQRFSDVSVRGLPNLDVAWPGQGAGTVHHHKHIGPVHVAAPAGHAADVTDFMAQIEQRLAMIGAS